MMAGLMKERLMKQGIVDLLNGFKIGMVTICFNGYRKIDLFIRVCEVGNLRDHFQ